MRTQNEIAERLKVNDDDIFGYKAEALLEFAEYSAFVAAFARKPGISAADWFETQMPLNRETVLLRMADYMEHAWTKALLHDSIGSTQSVNKLEAWIWLLGDEEYERVWPKVEAAGFANYGAPRLAIPAGRIVTRVAGVLMGLRTL
jgi:hypothetical protein